MSSTEEEHRIALQSRHVKSMAIVHNWMMNSNEEGKELTEGEDWKILLLRGIPSWHWCTWTQKIFGGLLQIPILIFVAEVIVILPYLLLHSLHQYTYVYYMVPSSFYFPAISNLFLMFCLIPICLHKILFHHPPAHLLLCVHHLKMISCQRN